jgi:hypothetical protein
MKYDAPNKITKKKLIIEPIIIDNPIIETKQDKPKKIIKRNQFVKYINYLYFFNIKKI